MRMSLELAEALPSIVKRKFEAAKASSDLIFSPTDVALIRTSNGIPASHIQATAPNIQLMKSQFQLRYCPSLAKKPLPKLAGATPKQKIDPFENPPEALHLVDIPTTNPTHFLVLNKFPIISQHFILATKLNKKQTHVLEQDDLEATYACLKAWHEEGDEPQRRLLAFFNSGEHSGASQPHRHLQFLPVERMRDTEKTNGWNMLIDLILSCQEANPPGKSSRTLSPFETAKTHLQTPQPGYYRTLGSPSHTLLSPSIRNPQAPSYLICITGCIKKQKRRSRRSSRHTQISLLCTQSKTAIYQSAITSP